MLSTRYELNINKSISRKSREWNIIYIFTYPNNDEYCKIGQTSLYAENDDWKEIDLDLIYDKAKERIKEIIKTPGRHAKLIYATIAIRTNENGDEESFYDNDFHQVLVNNKIERSVPDNNLHSESEMNDNFIKSTGKEWFKISPNDAINYLEQYKQGKNLFSKNWYEKISLRVEQKAACDAILKAWNKSLTNDNANKNFLLDAIMRFGKCITTYSFINEAKISKTLILTHRPSVINSWSEDFEKIFNNQNDPETMKKQYSFIQKKDNVSITNKENFIYFASIQDMRGVEYKKDEQGNYILDENGEKQFEVNEHNKIIWKKSNKDIFDINWDLVVIDEAHEGNSTSLAEKMHDSISKKFSLFLSGTTYNLRGMSDFAMKFGSNYYAFTLEDEQKLKLEWSSKHGTDSNPYANNPDLKLLCISIKKENLNNLNKNYFDFNTFFELNDDGQFRYEKDILDWLDNITSNDENDEYLSQMPFHISKRFHNPHSLWLLPRSVQVAKALEKLLKNHWYFQKNNYKIFNVAGSYNNNNYSEIRKHTDCENKRSIILSIGRLTQGTTLPGLTSVLMLDNSTSAIKYMQTIFRAKTPSPKHWKTIKTSALIFDFNPDRMLDTMYQLAKERIKSEKNEILSKARINESLERVTNFLNVMGFIDNSFKTIDANSINVLMDELIVNRIIEENFVAVDELIDLNKVQYLVNNSSTEIDNLLNDFDSLSKKKNFSLILNKHNLNQERIASLKYKNENKKVELNLQKIKSIIKNIFCGIPYLLLGKLDQISDDLINLNSFSINYFCNLYDDIDWFEIMPSNMSKSKFEKFVYSFVKEEIFLKSCIQYIKKFISITKIDEHQLRFDTWLNVLTNFNSLDKETFFVPNEFIEYQINSLSIDWKSVYQNEKTFIDINFKTLPYMIYVVKNLLNAQIESGEKVNLKKILSNQIFILCRTLLIKNVAIKVMNFDFDTENVFVHDLKIDFSLEDSNFDEIKKVILNKSKKLTNTNFDYCIGNPPYKLEVTNNNLEKKTIYFDKFFSLATKISNIICMSFPAKWLLTTSRGLSKFRESILDSKNIEYLIDCNDKNVFSQEIMSNSGLSIICFNNLFEFTRTKIGYFNNFKLIFDHEWNYRKLNEYGNDIFIIDNQKYKILKKIESFLNITNPTIDWNNIDTMSKYIYSQGTFNLESNFYKDKKYLLSKIKTFEQQIKVYYINDKTSNNEIVYGNLNFGFLSKEWFNGIKEIDLINKWKVCIQDSYGSRNNKYVLARTFIAGPNEIITTSHRICKVFDNENDAKLFSYFMESRFLRFLVSICKISSHAGGSVFRFVPYCDVINKFTKWQIFTNEEEKRNALDHELMDYFQLSDDDKNYIFDSIKSYSNS